MERKDMQVLGRVSYLHKIATPVFFVIMGGGLLALAIFVQLDIAETMLFSALGIFLIIAAVPFVLIPVHAVLYDSQRGALVLRAGQTIFGGFKTRVVPISQILEVRGIPMKNSFTVFYFQNLKAGLFIKTAERTIKITTVAEMDAVAYRIAELIKKHERSKYY